MFKKVILLLLVSMVVGASPLYSQWAKVYGKEGLNFETSKVLNAHGGGYIASGIYFDRNDESFNGWAGWVMKVSRKGSLEWIRHYSPVLAMTLTSDGGYVAVGWDTIFKIDGFGTLIWHKKVKIERFESIEQTSDAGFITVGTTYNQNEHAHCLIKFSNNGKIEWNKKFAIQNLSLPNLRVQETSDGGYFVVGNTKLPWPYPKSFWIMKISPKGRIQWQKRFGGMEVYLVKDFVITSKDDCLLMGSHELSISDIPDSNIWLMKIRTNGDIAWQKEYGQANGYGSEVGFSIINTQDGGYLISGRTSYRIDFEIMALKLSNNGTIEWFKIFGDTNGNSVTDVRNDANSACQAKRGRFIVLGNTNTLGMDWHTPESPRQDSIVLLKLKKNGGLTNCPLLEDGPFLQKVNTSYPLIDYSYALRDFTLTAKNAELKVRNIDVTVVVDVCSFVYQY